ncbi:lysoplasmalogenase family protein [Butyrivibrio fibrisolvens]
MLFFISDIILIINNFGPKYSVHRKIISIALYYIGQLLIAGSLNV